MSISTTPLILIIIISLLLMALFSLFESAFLSTNKLKLEINKKASPSFNKISTTFSRNRWFFRSFTLTGYTISLVIFATATIALFKEHTTLSTPLIIVWTTLLILLTIGYIPKTIINTDPNFYYRILAYPAWIFNIILYPISKVTTLILKIILKIFNVKDENNAITEQFSKSDLAYLFNEAAADDENQGSDAKDIKIMQNALEFSDMRIRDCMIRPADIEGLEINTPMEEAKKMFATTKFSRLPIYDDSIYNIVGYINIKQLFKYPKSIKEMVREIIYVPETISAQRVLTTLIKQRQSIAVVLDEFGQAAGIVTMEDILEEIFGEIQDEHDTDDIIENLLPDGTLIISAKIYISNLNEKFSFNIPESEHYDTLAGYILHIAESIPARGETVENGNLKIKILKMNDRRIELVKIEKKQDTDQTL